MSPIEEKLLIHGKARATVLVRDSPIIYPKTVCNATNPQSINLA